MFENLGLTAYQKVRAELAAAVYVNRDYPPDLTLQLADALLAELGIIDPDKERLDAT
jgi:hypothetical protein